MNDSNGSYESCLRCGANRVYDQEKTRFLYESDAMLGPVAEQESSTPTRGECVGGRDHIWEPLGDDVFQCDRCKAREVEIDGHRRAVLGDELLGYEVTELTANPNMCEHRWSKRRGEYTCEWCGLISQTPW